MAEFKPADMAEKLQFLTLDIISEIAFGEAFGSLESDSDISSYMKTAEGMMPLIILLGTWPALAKVFFWKPLRPLLPKETDTVGMGKLMGLVAASQLLRLDLTCSPLESERALLESESAQTRKSSKI